MTTKEIEIMKEEYPYLDKPCYTENFNAGQTNLKELLQPQNLLIILWYIILVGAFIMN